MKDTSVLALQYWFGHAERPNKDRWLEDRNRWEELQSFIVNNGGKHLVCEEVKTIIRNLDKSAALTCSTVSEAEAKLKEASANQSEYGVSGGEDQIRKFADRVASAVHRKELSPEYIEYINNDPRWKARRDGYLNEFCRVAGGWKCEMCGKVHQSKSSLNVHHNDYSVMLGNEPSEHLCGVCNGMCHNFADAARRVNSGRVNRSDSIRPLFLNQTEASQ